MQKLIVSTVSCVNEFASGYPELVSIVVDDALASRIRNIAAWVKDNNLLLAEVSEYGSVWSNCDEDTALDAMQVESLALLINDQQHAALNTLLQNDVVRVDAPLIRVFASSFVLAATPRHCGDDMALHTPSIPLTALDNPEYLFNEVVYA
ncbi:hypothetical protein EXW94_26205 [Enterobacter sp. JMULE2]|uniref:hypothetical protein n=1 Tax=Enterobacter sp. JMULE2 TaxID=2518340 RepID=UPI001575EB0C|nr:hypothetical protein [Enterobacter sp. JMULE2]NTZ41094.1 hypothetical protein [Enterobacter sp. JMULE2]